jgi:hypothetical protein
MSEIPASSLASSLPPATIIAAWRVLLRGAGAFLGLFVFCFWAAKGYHRGWTQNQVQVKQIDPITEIAYVTYERRFVPGLDVLGGGILLGVVIFGVTFWPARSPQP